MKNKEGKYRFWREIIKRRNRLIRIRWREGDRIIDSRWDKEMKYNELNRNWGDE